MKDKSEVIDVDQHNKEIHQNQQYWDQKPILRNIYKGFHKLIADHLSHTTEKGLVVELGSGIGNIKEVIPACIRTDLFPNPWIDRVENAYSLSFANNSVSALVLFDVFHHLRYPGTAFKEFYRVLVPNGRIILLEPCMSALGLLVFGPLHHEPLGLNKAIQWFAPSHWSVNNIDYYAAQANATKVFWLKKYQQNLEDWRIVKKKRISAVSYVASGGYSGPQLYPDITFPVMRFFDKIFDIFPLLFATRLLIVLEKNES